MTDTVTTTAGHRYLAEAARLVERLADEEWGTIAAAADLVADALARGGDLHAFGSFEDIDYGRIAKHTGNQNERNPQFGLPG